LVLCSPPDVTVTVEVRLEQETIWLNLSPRAALFERDKSVISRYLRHIFKSDELDRNSVIAFFGTTAAYTFDEPSWELVTAFVFDPTIVNLNPGY
jgi:hypothetical protein